ncbi:MAG: carboxypeptidase-like regulatory domain-containing protein [Planctomycetota bacterium]|nr:carboxypeptidase-like regulatory domain-containing protein [Planctomycetota bacterium]
MPKLALLILVLAAAVLAAVLVLDQGAEDEGGYEYADDYLTEEGDPELRTSPGAGPRDRSGGAKKDNDAETREPPRGGNVRYLAGTVTDAATGKPVAGAALRAEHATSPCPRLPFHLRRILEGDGISAPGPATQLGGATSDAEGRFTWTVGDVRMLRDRHDVFVTAAGYVPYAACQPTIGEELVVKLTKAIPLAVEVTDSAGRPIPGATLEARPAPTQAQPVGHTGVGACDENGRGSIDGLLPGLIVLRVDHPAWMPLETEPFDPAAERTKRVQLLPALRLTMRIRSDDGTSISNPTLAWRTDGTPPREDLQILFVRNNGPENEPTAEVISRPVRVPCEHRNVHLEVKADGFAAWRATEPVPVVGGERELIAVLARDIGLGSLELQFIDPEGQAVNYSELGGALPSILSLSGADVGSLVLQGGTTLSFPSMPAGRYRIGKRTALYAPAEVDAEVRLGEKTELEVRLRPAARLRVQFTADTEHMVAFRLLRGSDVLHAFALSEDGTPVSVSSDGAEPVPLSARGGAGALLGGLPAGSCTIEVTSPELVGGPRTVQLQEGSTTEVEIEVRSR